MIQITDTYAARGVIVYSFRICSLHGTAMVYFVQYVESCLILHLFINFTDVIF